MTIRLAKKFAPSRRLWGLEASRCQWSIGYSLEISAYWAHRPRCRGRCGPVL